MKEKTKESKIESNELKNLYNDLININKNLSSEEILKAFKELDKKYESIIKNKDIPIRDENTKANIENQEPISLEYRDYKEFNDVANELISKQKELIKELKIILKETHDNYVLLKIKYDNINKVKQ